MPFYCEHCEKFLKDDKEELYWHIQICDNFTQITQEDYEQGIKEVEE